MRYALVCLLLCAVKARGQQFLARHFSVAEGLPHSTVYRILEDKKGFLWFCTDGGLCSFDGHSFKTQLAIDDSFLYSSPISISEDEDGNKIVCSYSDGVFILTDTGITKCWHQETSAPKFSIYAVPDDEAIWMCGRRAGTYLYRLNGNNIKRYDLANDTGGQIQIKKVLLIDRKVVITTEQGLYTIVKNEVRPFLRKIVAGSVSDIKKDKEGHYVIAQNDRIVVADTNQIITEYPLHERNNTPITACDKNGNIWVLINGKKMLLLRNGTITDISDRLPTKNLYINDMAEDSEGNMWLATYNEGVYMILSTDILEYRQSNESANSQYNSIESLGNDRMLVGSIGNVSIFSGGKLTPLTTQLLARDEFVYFAKQIGNYVYIGTPYKVIRKSIQPPYAEESVDIGQASGGAAIYADRKGRIWIGGFEYLYVIDGGKVARFDMDTLLRHKRYADILEDTKGNYWFASNTGVVKYNGKKCELLLSEAMELQRSGNAVIEDSKGRIWAATNAGLVCVNNEKVTVYTKKDGLLSIKCIALCEDKENNRLWIGTPNGLNYMDLEHMQIRAYLDGIDRKDMLCLHLNGHTLYLGSSEQLFSINTVVNDDNSQPPPVYINQVRTSTQVVNMPKNVYVPYNENKIIIDFIAISYRNPNGIEYRYKVKNLDDNWRVTTNHLIELAALPSGEYTFVLNARKRNGTWGPDIELPISVSTPFWRNYSFIIIVVAGLGYTIFMLSRRQTERREAKKREKLLLLNKIAYLRQQALSALINPHFIFNCMNSIQHFLNRKDNERANSYLADFAGLIRLTMEHAQEMFIPLDSEIDRLQLYLSLEQLRFGDGLSFSITVDEHIDTHGVWIPNMIVQPYVENAIWHGIMPKEGKGIISITFGMQGKEEMRITVQDNGVGILQSKKKSDDGKKHYGMSLTEERLQLLRQISGQHYSIRVNEVTENNECLGTRVEIVVPIKLRDVPELEEDDRTS